VKDTGNITVIDILAVWGAFIATLVLLWDIIKWRASGRPKITLGAHPNMNIYNDSRIPEDKTFISVEAINKGDKPTTITNLGFRCYQNWFYRLLKKSRRQAVVGNTCFKPLPHVLGIGTNWTGIINQEELENIIHGKEILIIELYLTHTKKPKKVRVRLKKSKIV